MLKSGDKTPKVIKDAVAQERFYQYYDFYQAIYYRKGIVRENETNKQKPVASVWFRLEDKEIINLESGYNHFPVVLERWETRYNQVYGYSPCMKSIRLIHDINEAEDLMRHRFKMEIRKPLAFHGFDSAAIF